MEKRPSEVITGFLNFLESAEREYESAYADVGREDNRVQTFLHDMEFAPDGKTRNRIATRLQQSRRARRKGKDRVQLYGKIHDFLVERQKAKKTGEPYINGYGNKKAECLKCHCTVMYPANYCKFCGQRLDWSK